MLAAPKGYTYNREFKAIKAPPKMMRRGGSRDVDTHEDIEALMSVVGSKNARDITRKNHFMSKAAFDEWNAKQPEGKYWADYYDVDDDGTEEFVVRGKDQDGPLVAVNGYTTKKSDWAVRRDYYEAYPKIGTRPTGGIGAFAKELYGEEYDNYGYPTDAYLERIKEAQKAHPGYSIRGGGSTSPYNIFVKRIVAGAMTQHKNELGVTDEEYKTIMKAIEARKGKGWLLRLAGELWTKWVKKPILEELEKSKALKGWKQLYHSNNPKLADTAKDNEKFEKWLFNRKEIKAAVKDFVKFMFVTESEEFTQVVDAFAYEIDRIVGEVVGMDRRSPPNSPGKSRFIQQWGVE